MYSSSAAVGSRHYSLAHIGDVFLEIANIFGSKLLGEESYLS